MRVDGSISNATASLIWTVGAAAYLVFLMIRFRAVPRLKIDRLLHFGGPWTLFQRSFWEGRIAVRPGLVSAFVFGMICLAAIYAVLDVLW